MRKSAIATSRFAWTVLCLWNLPLLLGCNRAPPEPEVSPEPTSSAEPPAIPEASSDEPAEPSTACVVPLVDPPAPPATSVTQCPDDPMGRPNMPYGSVKFTDAKDAPELKVELALNNAHRSHGLMFRPTLEDDEGMLFTWPTSKRRTFWMENTCLALDMLFIQEDGTISGILRQVPPMNRARRTISCDVHHVLEVRAGWTEEYGVEPGQKIAISSPPDAVAEP